MATVTMGTIIVVMDATVEVMTTMMVDLITAEGVGMIGIGTSLGNNTVLARSFPGAAIPQPIPWRRVR